MKQPNWKTPLILSASLLAIGSFAYWLQYSHKPKEEKSESQLKKPLGIPSDDSQIAYFKIKSTTGLIEAKCDDLAKKKCKVSDDGHWTLTYPKTYPADTEAVKTFLKEVTGVLATETVDLKDETPEKRKQLMDEYGLSPEKRTSLQSQFIELTLGPDQNGKETKLTAWFGAQHPIGDKTFVARAVNGQVNDQTIFLISNFFKSNFGKTVTTFRDKKLFDFDRSTITAFTAKTSSGKLSAAMKDQLWTINGFAGDYDRMETLLSAISQLKAIEFPESSILKGLKPIVTYELTGSTKDQHFTLSLYEKDTRAKDAKKHTPPEKHYYATNGDKTTVFEVPALIRTQIDKSVSDLRDGLLLSQAEKVTTTRFQLEGKAYPAPVTFEFKDGSWTAPAKTEKKIDGNNIPKLFDIMTRSRVKAFVAPPSGAHVQELTLSMGDDKNSTRSHYLFFTVKKGKEEHLYAKDLNSKTHEALELDDGIYKNALPFTPDSWKMGK